MLHDMCDCSKVHSYGYYTTTQRTSISAIVNNCHIGTALLHTLNMDKSFYMCVSASSSMKGRWNKKRNGRFLMQIHCLPDWLNNCGYAQWRKTKIGSTFFLRLCDTSIRIMYLMWCGPLYSLLYFTRGVEKKQEISIKSWPTVCMKIQKLLLVLIP